MHILSILFIYFILLQPLNWLTNLDQAKAEAKAKNKLILLNFSGSDWCKPCIKLEKEIFESEAFQEYAATKLVLVKADFPRLQKNQLNKSLQVSNKILAENYNKPGAFPLTLLLDANGKVLKQWDGIPAKTPIDFITQLTSPGLNTN